MKKKFYDYIVEWDDAKNELNIKKHGFQMITDAYVFSVYKPYLTIDRRVT